jgi:hypothetical protein
MILVPGAPADTGQHQLDVHLAPAGHAQREHVHAEVVPHSAVRGVVGAVGGG